VEKRISTRAACLVIVAIMLVGVLTVSAINGSPYENLKNAAINALFYENFTLESEFIARVDGQLYERSWSRQYHGHGARFEISEIQRYSFGEEIVALPIRESMSFNSGSLSINPQFSTCDTQWYRVLASVPFRTAERQSIGYDIFGAAGRNSNYLRLAELVVDLFVGDLKNNLVMTSQSDGTRRISGAITQSQLPEIARIIIDIFVEDQLNRVSPNRTRADYAHMTDAPVRRLSIDRIQGHADIDQYGNLLSFNALGVLAVENIFGETYVMELEATISFTDIGTTVPDGPFVNADEIFAEFFEELHQVFSRTLFFTLDEDGNIDVASITDQRPIHPNTCPSFYTAPLPTPELICELEAEAS